MSGYLHNTPKPPAPSPPPHPLTLAVAALWLAAEYCLYRLVGGWWWLAVHVVCFVAILAVAAWSSVRAGRDVERAERGDW